MLYLDRSIEQFVRWKKSYVKGVGPGVFAKQFDAIYSQVELKTFEFQFQAGIIQGSIDQLSKG